MLVQKAFKFRLRTTPELEERLRRMAGCRRFVWNTGLAMIKAALESGQKRPSYADLSASLVPLKAELPWLREDAVAQSLQQTCKDLDRAVKDAFDENQPLKTFPVFKRRGKCTESFRIPQGFQVDQGNSRIKLPKLGWIRYRNSRTITGMPKNITISLNCGHWYASIQTEREVPEPVHASASVIGGDRGINSFLALSDGTLVQPLNSFAGASRKLARFQRQLSRKTKFSQNWRKQKEKISRLHRKIADMRKNYLHELSTTIAKSHGVVVLEDLKIGNMSTSAAGTIEAPGKNVKQKSGLNRAILDQGWGEFARQLEYKLRWLGGKLVKVPAQFTSQRCAACGHIHASNRKGQRFQCQRCGHKDHADINAAKNIKAAGLVVIACGEHPDARGSMKQEPPGGIHALSG